MSVTNSINVGDRVTVRLKPRTEGMKFCRPYDGLAGVVRGIHAWHSPPYTVYFYPDGLRERGLTWDHANFHPNELEPADTAAPATAPGGRDE